MQISHKSHRACRGGERGLGGRRKTPLRPLPLERRRALLPGMMEAHPGHAASPPGPGKASNQMPASPIQRPIPWASHLHRVLLAHQCPAKSSASSLEEEEKEKAAQLPTGPGLAWASARVPVTFVFLGSLLSCPDTNSPKAAPA